MPAEPTTRDNLLAFDKTLAEGTPEEIKIVLGWHINARLLRLSLPSDKREAWTVDIHRLMLLRTTAHVQ